MNKNILYYMWLAGAFPYGSAKLGQVLDLEPDACAFYHHFRDELERFSFLTSADLKRLNKFSPKDYRKVVLESRKKGIHIVCYADENYPARLRHIDTPPAVLYYCGDLSILSERCVTIVGTRHPSDYTKKVANQFAQELAAYGIVIVSGCAGGIDTEAHTGALKTGKTVALLGTSLDANYPAFNRNLKHNIYQQGGLLITEYPIGFYVNRSSFSIRNRLLSGLSDAVLIMEAAKGSGALVTASYALEQGKEVFCLPPADITNQRYDGVKGYLRDGARPLLSVSDVLESYRFRTEFFYQNLPKWESIEEKEEKVIKKQSEQKQASLSQTAKEVFSTLSERTYTTEELMEVISASTSEIFSALTELELVGLIAKSGNGYCKK